MRFSDEFPDDCYLCDGEHPNHYHHALDHPDQNDHVHDEALVDEHELYSKPYHVHGSSHPVPPEENMYNADLARAIQD